MEIKVINSELKSQVCDVSVIGLWKNTEVLSGVSASVDEACGELISNFVLKKDKFEADFKNTYLLQTYDKLPAGKILVIGLGEKEKFDGNRLRELTAKVVQKLENIKAKKVCIDLGKMEFDASISGEMVSEGALIGEYSFDKYKTTKKDDKKIKELIRVESDSEKFKKLEVGVNKGVKIANAMTFARNLSNEPAQYATPTRLADIARKIEGVKTKIFEKDDIETMGMGAFLAVGKCSAEFPKFIHMKYTSPANPKKKIAIIGKGICFDSGGLDLKPASSMLTMRDDMSGAACVLAVMSLLQEFNPNVEVHGLIAACENMPSGSSYKPGDILTAKNGKTIEVYNTDAEGRLTLADALCYACELGVDEVIDIATLTGACMVALGTQASGILGNNQELIDSIIKIGMKNGEKFWQMPMFEEYFEPLKSDIADMKNTGGRWGGTSSAALFLQEFVSNDVAWAHLDIAGSAFLDAPQKEMGKGSVGLGVRTLINYILGI